MTRAARHPELFTDETILDEILKDWHAAVGKAILENWEFADRMAEGRRRPRTTSNAKTTRWNRIYAM